ncbi:MAG: hypothetical protein RLZ37_322 [Actinomycetota bacterium]|jgi:hypothetical protein
MVVRRGQNWGSIGTPPPSTPFARDDAHAGQLIEQGVREFILASGDLARTLGASFPSPGCSYRRLPIDLVRVCVVDSRGLSTHQLSMSHCLIHRRLLGGGLLRGRITAICNSQYLHGRDIAPRGHPNDGKIEVVEFSGDLSIRQRLLVLKRMKTGDHLPHPLIQFRQISDQTTLNAKGIVVLDGCRIGSRIVRYVEPLRDEVVVWVAAPIGARETHD